MSRGLAVLGAFVLVVLAVFARNQLAGDSDGSGSDGTKPNRNGKAVVACTPDLAAVCDALADAGRIAADPPTLDLDGASSPEAAIDAWITWNPAPQIANFGAAPTKVWEEPVVLGSAVQAVLTDSFAELPAACRTKPTWRCLGDTAPGLAIGVGDPNTAEGLARLTPFARADTTDDDFQQLDETALDDLVRSPTTGQSDATTMAEQIVTAPGTVNLVAGPNDLLQAQAATDRGEQRELRLLTPGQQHRLVVVITERVGRDGSTDDADCDGKVPDQVVSAFEDLGLQPCEGRADDALAGFLFQVQQKVG